MGIYAKKCEISICGADAINNRGFVNKLGTLPLMLVSKHFGLERFVVSPLYKLDKSPKVVYPFEFVDANLSKLITENY